MIIAAIIIKLKNKKSEPILECILNFTHVSPSSIYLFNSRQVKRASQFTSSRTTMLNSRPYSSPVHEKSEERVCEIHLIYSYIGVTFRWNGDNKATSTIKPRPLEEQRAKNKGSRVHVINTDTRRTRRRFPIFPRADISICTRIYVAMTTITMSVHTRAAGRSAVNSLQLSMLRDARYSRYKHSSRVHRIHFTTDAPCVKQRLVTRGRDEW